ncbi:MAG: hypothetical protein Q9191_008055 [Dirinaria sp. TL-2023a]
MAEDKKRDDVAIELGERRGTGFESPVNSPRGAPPAPMAAVANNPILPVISYCGSSIMMTVTNKFLLSGTGFNLNSFLLAVQALQFLSIPVYTIFKNLTIILIAYGEVLWFGGSVTGMALFSFGLMVLSSVIAAWADVQHALQSFGHATEEASAKVSTLNAGYMWMLLNCICSAAYVLGMRKRIKLTNFKDFDTLNKLPIALSGLVFFDAPVTVPSVSAIAVGFVSGIVYAVAKVQQQSKPKTGALPTTNPPISASSQSARDSFKS